MRITYLSQSYVPSRRASAVQVMNMCAAWSSLGHEVLLVTKRSAAREEPGVEDDFEFYGVPRDFRIDKLLRPAWRGGGLLFDLAVRRLIDRESARTDLFFCRDPLAADRAASKRVPFAFEAHVPPQDRRTTALYRRFLEAPSCRGLVVISRALKEFLEASGLIGPAIPVVVAPDAAAPPLSAPGAGGPGIGSGIDPALPCIGYVGQLHAGKGLEMIEKLALALPEASFHVVGGDAARLEALRGAGLPPNLQLHGFVEPGRLAGYYAAFDIVLMPYERTVRGASAGANLANWMSPLKMFEYMAAGKAMVAADLPVLREVLRHEENALLAPAGEIDAWVHSLRRLLDDPDLKSRLGESARSEAAALYTWEARAKRILEELGVDAS
jgi:glycosyltransferase involved in cell wall biosynthesis